MPSTRFTLSALHWVDVLRGHAQQKPDALGFVHLSDGTQISAQITYGQLDRRARAIASELQDRGLAGQRVLLLFPNNLHYIAAFMGCLYAGVTAVPVYPPQMGRQIDRMQAIRQDCGARAMLTSRMVLSMVKTGVPALIEEEAEAWIPVDDIPDQAADEWLAFTPQSDDLAFLQYTSGSTGAPKGVRITHGNLLHNQGVIQQAFRTGSDTILAGWLPLYHDMGLIGNVLHPLYLGRPLYLMSPLTFLQNPLHWLQAISHFGATVAGGPNFAYELCTKKIADEAVATLDLSRWETAFSGAEPVRGSTLRRFAAKFAPAGFRMNRFLPCYGLAEATLAVSGGKSSPLAGPTWLSISRSALQKGQALVVPQDDPDAQELVACGYVGEGLNLQIVDPDTAQVWGENRIGEIWVQGQSVGQGYWQQPERNRDIFEAKAQGQEGTFLRTGDLGFMHQNQLYITGRRKDLIIIRGKNHYPQDIEHTVEQVHAELRPGAGVAVSLEKEGEERLLILQEVQRGQLSDQESSEIIAAIREAVSVHHELQPYAIVLLARKSILKTSSGKIQRSATREAYLAGQLRIVAEWVVASAAADAEAPEQAATSLAVKKPSSAAEIQRWIIAWLSRKIQLPVNEIDPADPINVYGVDSMLVQEFESDLSQYLGMPWAVSDLLLTEPSIQEIAARGEEVLTE
jgi:acyl-CoA synthetase (AMP-forming)/AMP-acid ligase II